MKKVYMSVLVVVLAFAVSASASAVKIGVGLGLNRADARVFLGDKMAVNGMLSFDVKNTVYGQDADVTSYEGSLGAGAYFLYRMVQPKPVSLHCLAGFSINPETTIYSKDAKKKYHPNGDIVKNESVRVFSIFAGGGSEYFLPGAENFSVEVNVGIGADFSSGNYEFVHFGFNAITGPTFRYYF